MLKIVNDGVLLDKRQLNCFKWKIQVGTNILHSSIGDSKYTEIESQQWKTIGQKSKQKSGQQ